ncbi:MAG: phosphatase PAP2 family protein [Oscillospiraceae bacterium]|nr:phosphatase PAP2 family protein [Oscillospiraceae bacterium]
MELTAVAPMELTAIAVWLNTAFAAFDESVAIAIHKLYEAAPGFFTPFLTLISLMGKGGAFLILLSLCLIVFRPTRRYGTAMLLGLAIGALITNIAVKPLVARPRPYTWDGSVYQRFWHQLGEHVESDKSFPSGHMTAAMAFSTALFLRGNRKISWTIFFFAFAMGISRIYLSVHYATDVLGGVVTGAVGGTAGYILSLRLPESYYRGDARRLLPGWKQQGRHQAVREEQREELVIDGDNFSDLRGFYAEIDRLFRPETPTCGLDALNDVLRGGLGGKTTGEPVVIRWVHADKSREDLGYETTAKYYEAALERVHPNNRERMERRLEQARAGEGETLFDRICTLIRRTDTGHDCELILE